MENIDATNKGAVIVFKASTGDLQVRVTIENFRFNNSLMKEHFNENYMETEKKVEANGAVTYPNRYAEFKGKIISLRIPIYASVASKARVYIDDGVAKTYSGYRTGQWLS